MVARCQATDGTNTCIIALHPPHTHRKLMEKTNFNHIYPIYCGRYFPDMGLISPFEGPTNLDRFRPPSEPLDFTAFIYKVLIYIRFLLHIN